MKRVILFASLAAALIAPALGRAAPNTAEQGPAVGAWEPGPQTYGVGSRSGWVTMSDGLRLSVRTSFPTDKATGAPAEDSFPVILSMTPYSKDVPVGGPGSPCTRDSAAGVQGLVARGYLHVWVDVRGSGYSEGTFGLFSKREQKDYVEVIDWAASIPGSNGKVGMIGTSYLGIAQIFSAGNVGPGSPLKAIFPCYTGVDLYRDVVMPGGLVNVAFDLPYAMALETALHLTAPAFGNQDPQRLATMEGQRAVGALGFPVGPIVGAEVGTETAYDGDFWQDRTGLNLFPRIIESGVAVFAYNGWFDIYQRGDASQWAGLQNASAGRSQWLPMEPGQASNPKFQTALAPATHYYLPPQASLLALEWFDTWLKNMPTGMAETDTPFHAYEIGGGRWIDSPTWPLPGTEVKTFYLRGEQSGSATHSLNDGTLGLEQPDASEGADTLAWTGANSPCHRMNDQEFIYGPVKGYSDAYKMPENPCFFDDRTAQVGALTYSSAPLDKDVTIAGPVGVALYATSTTTDAEFVVTLDDVSADGSSRPLSTGALLGSMREVDASRSWVVDGKLIAPYHPMTKAAENALVPGEVTRLDIEIPATLARVRVGHRIRITISGSLAPYLVPPAYKAGDLAGGVYEVQRTAIHASRVNIPLVDPDGLATSPVNWGDCNSDC